MILFLPHPVDCFIIGSDALAATHVDCTITGCPTLKLSVAAFQHQQQSKLWSRLHHTGTAFTDALQSPPTPS